MVLLKLPDLQQKLQQTLWNLCESLQFLQMWHCRTAEDR